MGKWETDSGMQVLRDACSEKVESRIAAKACVLSLYGGVGFSSVQVTIRQLNAQIEQRTFVINHYRFDFHIITFFLDFLRIPLSRFLYAS